MRSPLWRRATRTRALAAVAALAAATALSVPGTAHASEPHQSNPFLGATSYVNPDYARLVDGSIAATSDTTLKAKMATVKTYPTAVWLDRIAAITGGTSNDGRLGLAAHLDAALAQKQAGTPITATFVVYDLPGRDCAALASNGELPLTTDGLNRYETEYIDAIAAILANPKYADVRIVTVIEPDSLPNLVTNLSDPECAQAKSSGIYVQGVQYALNKLHAIPNVYTYLDIAHSGWLGWDNNLSGTVQLYTDLARGTTAGFASVDGVVTNTANYTPTVEPFLTDPNAQVGGQPVKSASFYEWNPNFDESDFTAAVYTQFRNAGWPADFGTLIDTSRNGWGGAARPGSASTSTTLNTYVNDSKVDRRAHRGLWCNVSGAGLGAPPQAAPGGYPNSHLDAYIWVKPPGESDGASSDVPNDEGKHADPMCNPDYQAPNAGGNYTGAMPNAPLAGHWFHDQFVMLITNAYPAVPGGGGGGDTTPPSAPTGLQATGTTSTSVSLSWTASTDNVGVAGYDVYQGSTKVGSTSGTTFTVSGLAASTTYSFTVKARDAAGNVSVASNALTATTQSGGGGTGSLKVQYKNNDSSTSDNAIRPGLQVVNTGTTSLNLSGVTVRYYFTKDGSASVNVWCDYAAVNCSTLTMRVGTLATPVNGADSYLEVGFTGGTLAAGANTGEMQLRMSKSDWSNFDETNDYSWGAGTAYTDSTKVTGYVSGALAWGNAPA